MIDVRTEDQGGCELVLGGEWSYQKYSFLFTYHFTYSFHIQLSPLSAKGCTGCMLGARWALIGCMLGADLVLIGCSSGSQLGAQTACAGGFSMGSHMPRTRVSGWDQGFGCWEFTTWLGSQKSGGVGARVGGLRARPVWESAARGAFAACAVERRALCAAGQRGGGVGAQRAAHKYRSPAGGLFFDAQDPY